MSREKHTRLLPDGRRGLWWTDRLWWLAADLPVVRIKIADIPEFDADCWFGERHAPTIREVAKHARLIAQADAAYPVILCGDGRLMDGGHRLAKAWIAGRKDTRPSGFPSRRSLTRFFPLRAVSQGATGRCLTLSSSKLEQK